MDVIIILLILTALLDAFNPTSIVSMLLLLKKNPKQTITFILTVFVITILIGYGFLYLFSFIPFLKIIAWVVAVFLILNGGGELILFLKDGVHFSLVLPKKFASSLEPYLKGATFGDALYLGLLTVAIVLPSLFGPYLAVLLLIKNYPDPQSLIGLYNLLMILPLLLMGVAYYFGASLTRIRDFQKARRFLIPVLLAVMYILLGIFLLQTFLP